VTTGGLRSGVTLQTSNTSVSCISSYCIPFVTPSDAPLSTHRISLLSWAVAFLLPIILLLSIAVLFLAAALPSAYYPFCVGSSCRLLPSPKGALARRAARRQIAWSVTTQELTPNAAYYTVRYAMPLPVTPKGETVRIN
jgi:hypothetical protein